MNSIVQQIMPEFYKKFMLAMGERLSEGGLMNLGKMCSQLEEGLKLLACEFIEMILEEINEELRRGHGKSSFIRMLQPESNGMEQSRLRKGKHTQDTHKERASDNGRRPMTNMKDTMTTQSA